jgi:hypothetical protein
VRDLQRWQKAERLSFYFVVWGMALATVWFAL